MGEMFARVLAFYFTVVAVLAFAFGALAVWGLPKLWAFLRPLIHQVTA